jgi:hypothetical protein
LFYPFGLTPFVIWRGSSQISLRVAFYALYQGQNQYPCQGKKENGGKELDGGYPPLEKKGKLFRSDTPVDDPEDD